MGSFSLACELEDLEMNYWLILIGVVFGSMLITLAALRRLFVGVLHIQSGEDGKRPYLFLELNDGPDKIVGKKYVVFRVKNGSRQ